MPCGLVVVGQPPCVCAWAVGANDVSTVVDTAEKTTAYASVDSNITIVVFIIRYELHFIFKKFAENSLERSIIGYLYQLSSFE